MRPYFLIIIIVLIAFPFDLFSQSEQKVYQLSGLVLNKVNGLPISQVKISVNKRQRFAISNDEGFFSIPVVEQDTLYFSHIGYYPNKLSMRSYLKGYNGDTSTPYIYEIQYMLEDTIELPTVIIYPYQTAEDIRQAIKYMNQPVALTFDEAQNNVSPELMSYFIANLPEDPNELITVARERYMNYYSNSNVMPTVGFDPVAVYGLLKYISNKKKDKQNRILNQDPDQR